MSIIFEPTKQIIYICDLIDRGINRFWDSMDNEHFGKYEFEVECLINITHSIRIFESILDLARKDLVYIQSALILSRSLFEILIKVSWILHPSDVFKNESRYVAQLNTEIEFWRKWDKEFSAIEASSNKHELILKVISDFKDGLSDALKRNGYEIPKLPNVRDSLKSLGEERKYINYMVLSQYVHATHYAGRIYRQNLGVYKELNEKVNMEDWKLVFAVCWPVFELATELYLLTTEGKKQLYTEEFKQDVRQSFLSLA